ncbi:MAG: slipin family protein [Gammaproteobacteria bacterium]
MFGYKRVVIAKHERGLLFRDRSFERFLTPGVYRFFDPFNRLSVERYDLAIPEFNHARADMLIKEHGAACAQHLQIVELGERQAGLVYKNDKLAGILAPGARQLYWKGPVTVRVDAVEVADNARIPRELAVLLIKPRDSALLQAAANAVYACEVSDHQVGLLTIDGELKEVLKPGAYAFWKFQRNLGVELADLRLQTLEVSGQEILTKDKVSLRLNLAVSFRLIDPVKARVELPNAKDFVYREAQFGLRQAVGVRTLDELLANKSQLDEEVFAHVGGKSAAHGLEVSSVGVKDVILPGDMKDILNQVVEAEKVAQANVIKRREETAATRSLLNTAKLMEDSPILLRLKELEMLEKVVGKIDKLTVFGGLEGVLQELVTIKAKQAS